MNEFIDIQVKKFLDELHKETGSFRDDMIIKEFAERLKETTSKLETVIKNE